MTTRYQVLDWQNNSGGIPVTISSPGDSRLNLANAPRILFISQNGYTPNELAIGFPLSWGANAPANSSFLGHWDFAQNAVELGTRIPAPFKGVIYRLSVRALDANWSAAGRIFTVRKNAASASIASNATAVTTNLVGNTATATIVNRGDALSIQMTGGALTNRIWATVFIVPTG